MDFVAFAKYPKPSCRFAVHESLSLREVRKECKMLTVESDNRDRFGLQMGQQNRKRRSENPDATTGLSTLSLKDGHLCWQEQVMGGCIGVTIGFDFFRRIVRHSLLIKTISQFCAFARPISNLTVQHQIIRIVYLANPSDRDSRIIISTHEMDAILDGGSFDYQYQVIAMWYYFYFLSSLTCQLQLKPTATAGWEDELMIFKGKWYDTRFKLHEPRLCRARHVPLVEYEEGCEPEEDLTPHHREEFLE